MYICGFLTRGEIIFVSGCLNESAATNCLITILSLNTYARGNVLLVSSKGLILFIGE